MKALIFAAGLGTRLYPYTSDTPKALVKVAGKPMLQHVIVKLKKFGIDSFIINIHHFGDQIIQFLKDHNHFDCDITISDERKELLDTGGGLKKVLAEIGENENLLVHNVDIFTDYDLDQLIKHHEQADSLISLLVQDRKTSRYLLFDKKSADLKGWINTNTKETIPIDIIAKDYHSFAFSGIHMINSRALKYFPEGNSFPIIPVYLNIAENHKISSLKYNDENWLDLGKPAQLEQAEKIINQ